MVRVSHELHRNGAVLRADEPLPLIWQYLSTNGHASVRGILVDRMLVDRMLVDRVVEAVDRVVEAVDRVVETGWAAEICPNS